MASSASYKQDLPPKGGYAPINFRRIPARQVGLLKKLVYQKSSAQVLNAPIIFTGLIGSMAVGHWLYKRGMRTWKTWVSPDTKSTFTNLTKFLLCSKQSTGLPLWPSPP